jgi:hypothetical protein
MDLHNLWSTIYSESERLHGLRGPVLGDEHEIIDPASLAFGCSRDRRHPFRSFAEMDSWGQFSDFSDARYRESGRPDDENKIPVKRHPICRATGKLDATSWRDVHWSAFTRIADCCVRNNGDAIGSARGQPGDGAGGCRSGGGAGLTIWYCGGGVPGDAAAI